MFVVSRGRLKAVARQAGQSDRLLEYLGRGSHFGEMALLTDGLRAATIEALVDSQLLELGYEHFNKLLVNVPGFAANLSRTLVSRLRSETARRERRHRPAVVGLVNSSAWTLGLAKPLAEALVARGESIEILTDRSERWPVEAGCVMERIPQGVTGEERVSLVHARIHQVLEHQSRILLELSQAGPMDLLASLLGPCETILWLVEPRFWETSSANLKQLLSTMPALASRVHLVWLMPEPDRFSPKWAHLNVARPDFKIQMREAPLPLTANGRKGVERLVRHLRGTRLGLALGGGGARGLAHLGVLRALEREGISFDLLAGTSSGALMGLSYAAGWPPEDAISEFKKALTPRRIVRALPGGSRWFMWFMFRVGAWDGMLRRYLQDTNLEQLPIPFSTVSVDLVTGNQVVRDTGDAIHAVLESINIPVVAAPIRREGKVLVDGGVLNNVPGDVLPARGANIAVGVDLVSNLPQTFAGNVPTTPTRRMRRAGLLETLLRMMDVQANSLTKMRVHLLDLMITPDTAAFEFADFSKGLELADVGEAAAMEVLPQLKQLVVEMENE